MVDYPSEFMYDTCGNFLEFSLRNKYRMKLIEMQCNVLYGCIISSICIYYMYAYMNVRYSHLLLCDECINASQMNVDTQPDTYHHNCYYRIRYNWQSWIIPHTSIHIVMENGNILRSTHDRFDYKCIRAYWIEQRE